MSISIIHPSRSRPDKSWKVCQDWLAKSHTSVELIISLDEDDPFLSEYQDKHKYFGTILVNNNRSAVDAINRAAEVAKGDILIVVSDDTECFYGWGRHIRNHMQGKCDWILKTQDGIQPWVITMPVMDRAYYERFGYIYHPSYLHAWCDTELTCVAELTDCKVDTNFNFPHNHHSIGKSEKDEVSERADLSFEIGRLNFETRSEKWFDLKDADIIGQVTPNIYTRKLITA